jgi:hypothetical protein
MALQLGARLGTSEILPPLGAGGIGEAYRTCEALNPKGAACAQIILSASATISSATVLIPCQMRKLIIAGTAGVSFRLPKVPHDWQSEKTFYRDGKNLVRPPVKACSS